MVRLIVGLPDVYLRRQVGRQVYKHCRKAHFDDKECLSRAIILTAFCSPGKSPLIDCPYKSWPALVHVCLVKTFPHSLLKKLLGHSIPVFKPQNPFNSKHQITSRGLQECREIIFKDPMTYLYTRAAFWRLYNRNCLKISPFKSRNKVEIIGTKINLSAIYYNLFF